MSIGCSSGQPRIWSLGRSSWTAANLQIWRWAEPSLRDQNKLGLSSGFGSTRYIEVGTCKNLREEPVAYVLLALLFSIYYICRLDDEPG